METSQRKNNKGVDALDEEIVVIRLLNRALNDFATRKSGDKWFEDSKNWLFGENKPLLKRDSRVINFTLDQVCEYLVGSARYSERVRSVALFMRRFKLTSKQFLKIYWGTENESNCEKLQGETDDDYDEFKDFDN